MCGLIRYSHKHMHTQHNEQKTIFAPHVCDKLLPWSQIKSLMSFSSLSLSHWSIFSSVPSRAMWPSSTRLLFVLFLQLADISLIMLQAWRSLIKAFFNLHAIFHVNMGDSASFDPKLMEGHDCDLHDFSCDSGRLRRIFVKHRCKWVWVQSKPHRSWSQRIGFILHQLRIAFAWRLLIEQGANNDLSYLSAPLQSSNFIGNALAHAATFLFDLTMVVLKCVRRAVQHRLRPSFHKPTCFILDSCEVG